MNMLIFGPRRTRQENYLVKIVLKKYIQDENASMRLSMYNSKSIITYLYDRYIVFSLDRHLQNGLFLRKFKIIYTLHQINQPLYICA